MSYLNRPRLTFAGSFNCNISTINNVPTNYDPQTTELDELWNPNGDGTFWFSATVTQVTYLDGTTATTPAQDPIIGMPLTSLDYPYKGKMVDLDPEQQMVSEIWGMSVILGDKTNPGNGLFQGGYRPSPFFSLWAKTPSQLKPQPSSQAFAAVYQSVLENITWGNVSGSRYLQELQSTTQNSSISIEFNLDSYHKLNPGASSFTQGRIVGTVGPYFSGEPFSFVPGRYIRPYDSTGQGNFSFNFAQCVVDNQNKVLIVDFGNSIQRQDMWDPATNIDPSIDQGVLTLEVLNSNPPVLWPISYSSDPANDLYAQTAYVQEFPLSDQAMSAIAANQLAVQQNGGSMVMMEAPDGVYIRAENFVLRMNPNDQMTVNLMATQFGAPANMTVPILDVTSNFLPAGANPPPAVGYPPEALGLPQSPIQITNGQGTFTITAGDTGQPRYNGSLDGQVYAVGYATDPGVDFAPDGSNFVSVHIYEPYSYAPPATWYGNTQVIFKQFGIIYPFMENFVDMTSYGSVYANRKTLMGVFTAEIHDPAYMPVTRDLSEAKRQMILEWLNNDCPQGTQQDAPKSKTAPTAATNADLAKEGTEKTHIYKTLAQIKAGD